MTDEFGEFATSLHLSLADQEAVYETLMNFPPACRSRGMFATGILEAVKREHGVEKAAAIRRNAGYPDRISSFALYPHRDFYRVFYASAAALYPGMDLGIGMRRIAESFYPIFIDSLAGRTMHALIGKTPRVVLGRFVEAYKISTPWNDHVVEDANHERMLWRCKVEPCPFYPETFAGISTGMVETVTGIRPQYHIVTRTRERDHQKILFEIRW